MNIKNNLTTVLIACLAALLIIALTVIVITGNNPDKYIGSISTLVGLLITAGVIGPRLDKVSKNVNGNTTRLTDENDYLRKRNAALEQAAAIQGTGPVVVAPEPLMSEDTIERIKSDRDSLPAHRSE